MVATFLGEPYEYWMELQKRIERDPNSMEVKHLLKDLISANSKVLYYELQIQRMNNYREAAKT